MATSLKQDLQRLKKLKDEADRLKAKHKKAEAVFKAFQQKCKDRMEAEEVESMKIRGTLFVPVETEFAKVNDRQAFVEWALENEPSLVEYKERKDEGVLNDLLREKIQNGEDLPPGLTFWVREYISQRAG